MLCLQQTCRVRWSGFVHEHAFQLLDLEATQCCKHERQQADTYSPSSLHGTELKLLTKLQNLHICMSTAAACAGRSCGQPSTALPPR